ncbi:diguanylate cyclase domain-containing protein [Solimicrobium silvestre]|uniref:diguanylate cyclase n=1 Tax=Solimicrobium silvestre TaxID=2099400 RepID=A0A2S9GX31_9BURK|nr:diguanylate cyclase [Solimicrobium silvestre]PRC92258.1 GGDEF: diguanylate cyclase (GGDEF) domain [Solimicrobium silvestre]
MGLRGKMFGLFLIGFGLMTIIVMTLLYSNLLHGFMAIERTQATEQMTQLARNLDSELDRLNQINGDWANWDDMVSYTQQPTHGFIEHQLNSAELQTVGLKFIFILDKQDNILFSNATNLVTGAMESASTFDPILANIKVRLHPESAPDNGRTCGLDNSTAGPVLVCWQQIHQTDHSGKPMGCLVVGQLLNSTILKRIQDQSGLKFELMPQTIRATEPPHSIKASIEPEMLEFSQSAPNILSAHLYNIVGQPILIARLQFSREVGQLGNDIIWKVMRVVLLVTALTGLTLLAGIHFLVIRRLRKMKIELNSIWRNGRWAGRLDTPKNKDELNELAHSINRMLALIRKQMGILESIAHTDALTQIANRRAFDQRMAIEMSLHKRNQTPLSLLLIDVDYFKRYNDYYGHPAGDEVLKEIGKLLIQVACRPSDLPARIGGEEFAVILPATDLAGAGHVAEKIRVHLAELKLAHADSPASDYVTISIGATIAGEEDLASFIQRADKATYQAKQSGRNKINVLPAV